MKIDEKLCSWFLCIIMTTWGHENWWKTNRQFFVIFCDPEVMNIDEKTMRLFFVYFHDRRAMKIDEKLCTWFLWFFVTPGSWQLEVMKIDEKWKAWFLCFFVTAGSWKLMKNYAPDFCDFLWPGGHENWCKTMRLIFVIFCDRGLMKIDEKLCAWFLWFFMKIDEKWKVWFLWFFVTAGHNGRSLY